MDQDLQPVLMCEVFNEYFASVFTSENIAIIPKAEQRWKGPEDEALSEIHLDARIVEERLSKLRADKSIASIDGLSPRLLKEIKTQIIQPILYIWRKSIESGIDSKDWRTANVCPIFKKGSRNEAGNYRPVSLTSQIGQLLESVI